MLKKFFIKRFRAFAFIMIIPLMTIFIIMGYLVIDTQMNDFKKMGANTFDSINENIMNNINSTIYQQDVVMRNPQYKLAMKKLLSHDLLEYRDIIFMNAMMNFLKSSELSYKYINSIYLYLDGMNNFLTSSSDELVSFTNYYDTEWLDHYRKIPKESKQFVETRRLQRYSYDKVRDVITIYQRMSYANGVIVLNVNASDFKERIQSILNSDQSFFLLNKDGGILFASNKETTLNVNSDEYFFKEIVQEYILNGEILHNHKWIKIHGENYLFYMEPDDQYQTYLVSMISFDAFMNKLQDYVRLAIAILLINIMIVMLLAWFITKSAFKHISYVVDVFSKAERGETVEEPQPIVKDEYNLILNNVLFLFIKNNQMQAKLLEKHHQIQITELMALQLQINPHFIFNTLQTMDLEVMKELGGQSTLHILIQELSRIMKYALTNPTEAVSLKEELDYLKAYLEIQEVRFNNNIITYYEIDTTLLDYYVFRLMLQPIIENSVTHGIKSINQRCCIKIKINKKNEYIYITVIDNGCGMSKQHLQKLKRKINDSKSKNIGLTNLNQRLILHYGEDSGLNIQSKINMGTVISFKIPIRKTEGTEILQHLDDNHSIIGTSE